MNLIGLFGSKAIGNGEVPAAPSESIQKQSTAISRLMLAFIVLVAALCVLNALAAFFSGGTSSVGSFAGFAFLLCISLGLNMASAALGGVAGFLFGIPRLLQRSPQNPPRAEPPAKQAAQNARRLLSSNSNLEEISDWLTKIIVGLGLVNIQKIPGYIDAYRDWLRSGLSELPYSAQESVFLVVLSLASLIGCFLFFYITTRTQLALLLSDTESKLDPDYHTVAEAPQFKFQSAWAGVTGTALPGLDLKAAPPSPDDEAVLSRPPAPGDHAERWAAWAAAKTRMGAVEQALPAWRVATAMSPDSAIYWQQYGDTLYSLRRYDDALDAYLKARNLGLQRPSLLQQILMIGLYSTRPDSTDLAIDAAEALRSSGETDAWTKLRRACAYAQRYEGLPSNSPEREPVRNTVKSAIEDIVRDVPDADDPLRKFMRQLLKPGSEGGDPNENDFAVFANDEEIVRLIMGEKR